MLLNVYGFVCLPKTSYLCTYVDTSHRFDIFLLSADIQPADSPQVY